MTEAEGIAEAERRIANWNGADVLQLGHLQLSAVPNSLRSLSKASDLFGLSLSHNQLDSLPDWIGELENLLFLNVSNNRITELPESIGHLRKLGHLRAEGN